MKLHSDKNPHVCSVCYKPFVCAAYLVRHQQVHFKEIESSWKMSSGGMYSVRNRTWVPPEHRRFPCPICPSRFSHASSLQQHLKQHNLADPGSTADNNACAVCNRSFTCQASLQKHLASHLAENQSKRINKEMKRGRKRKWAPPEKKPFSCNLCSSSFMLENTFNKHMKLHSTGSTWHLISHYCLWYNRIAMSVLYWVIHEWQARVQIISAWALLEHFKAIHSALMDSLQWGASTPIFIVDLNIYWPRSREVISLVSFHPSVRNSNHSCFCYHILLPFNLLWGQSQRSNIMHKGLNLPNAAKGNTWPLLIKCL